MWTDTLQRFHRDSFLCADVFHHTVIPGHLGGLSYGKKNLAVTIRLDSLFQLKCGTVKNWRIDSFWNRVFFSTALCHYKPISFFEPITFRNPANDSVSSDRVQQSVNWDRYVPINQQVLAGKTFLQQKLHKNEAWKKTWRKKVLHTWVCSSILSSCLGNGTGKNSLRKLSQKMRRQHWQCFFFRETKIPQKAKHILWNNGENVN